MNIERKQQIKDEMITHLAGQLDAYCQNRSKVATVNSWGENVEVQVSPAEIAAIRKRTLDEAKSRVVLEFLSEKSLDPRRLAAFVEPWLKVAKSVLEGGADAVEAVF